MLYLYAFFWYNYKCGLYRIKTYAYKRIYINEYTKVFGVKRMIKKLKNFYKNNRIYSILMIISLFCLILMVSGVVIYFVNQTVSSEPSMVKVCVYFFKLPSDLSKYRSIAVMYVSPV